MEQNQKNSIMFCEKCQIHYFPNFEDTKESYTICSNCNSELTDTGISYEEYKTLPKTKRCKQCKRKYPKFFIKCPKCKSQLIKLSTENKNDNKQMKSIISQNFQQNTPKCPTCGSTNVNKISTAKKAAGFLAVGVFSSNLGKTMECKNCGYKW